MLERRDLGTASKVRDLFAGSQPICKEGYKSL